MFVLVFFVLVFFLLQFEEGNQGSEILKSSPKESLKDIYVILVYLFICV